MDVSAPYAIYGSPVVCRLAGISFAQPESSASRNPDRIHPSEQSGLLPVGAFYPGTPVCPGKTGSVAEPRLAKSCVNVRTMRMHDNVFVPNDISTCRWLIRNS